MKKTQFVVFGLIIILLVFVILLLNDKSQNTLNSSTETSQSSRSGNQTSSMYANMTGDQFDKAYLTDMIAHHQGALNMASQARELATKAEIRTLADAILSSQSTEVQQMLDWQQAWNYTATDSSNPHAGHMMESSGSMGDDMANMEAKLNGLSGEAYDKEFLKQMILHHQQAVDMSKYADTNAKHQEVKDLAQAVITAQEKEIADMKSWQQKWGF
ncbi:MAG: DUF305 domain-containing protein [Candidatus Saccharimonas sp.]|nr:DUF305 domain-containing protein [Candidatus Saccharimonas sp.]